MLTILRAVPFGRWAWDQVASIGGQIEVAYWKGMPACLVSDESASGVIYALRKLIEIGRARHAVGLAGRRGAVSLPSDLLIELLQEAVRQPFKGDGDSNEDTMFQHYVAQILATIALPGRRRQERHRHAGVELPPIARAFAASAEGVASRPIGAARAICFRC